MYNRYVKYSITVSVVESRNKIQKQLKNMLLNDVSPNKTKAVVSDTKTVVSDFYLKSN